MIQCNKCNVQYIGETKYHLSDRFSEHRCAIEKAIAKQHIDQPTAVSDHFTLPAHSIDNIELVPLELITLGRGAIHKAREAFLISKDKTLGLFGLNRRDEFDLFIFCFSLKYIHFGILRNVSLFLSANHVTYFL